MDETERLRLIVLDMKLRLRDSRDPILAQKDADARRKRDTPAAQEPHASCCASLRARLGTMSVQDDDGLARRRVSPLCFSLSGRRQRTVLKAA